MNTNSNTQGTINPSVPGAESLPDPERHARKCEICHHPNRAEIEEAFINWRSSAAIASIYKVSGRKDAIYRHAHALGLFDRRRQNIHKVAELIMEKAELSNPTASEIIHAIAVHSRLTGERDVSISHTMNVVVTRRWDPAGAGTGHQLPTADPTNVTPTAEDSLQQPPPSHLFTNPYLRDLIATKKD